MNCIVSDLSYKSWSFKMPCQKLYTCKLFVLIVEKIWDLYPKRPRETGLLSYSIALWLHFYNLHGHVYTYLFTHGQWHDVTLFWIFLFFLFCLVLPFSRKGDTCISVQHYHNRYHGSMFWKGKLTDSCLVCSPSWRRSF